MEFLVLRWLHIAFGALWAGAGIAMGWFIVPSFGAAGPAGRPVMEALLARRFPQVMMVSGLITVLAGLRMYMLIFSMAWLGTTQGILITAGALAGIAALVVGTLVQGRNGVRMGKLAATIAASGGPPSAEQQAELGAIQQRMATTANVLAWLLAVAIVAMAGARTFA